MAFVTLNYENFVRGDDWTFSYTITDANEQPVDIRGYTFYFTMKAAATDADPGALQISKYLDPEGIYADDAQNGILVLDAGSLNTTNVNSGVYQYDLQQLDDNNKVKTLYMGTVTVLPDITRSTVGTPPPDAAIVNNLEYATVSYVNNLASFSTIDKGELDSLALGFISDANSGFYGKDDDEWALVAGGIEKVNISTDGIDITGDLTVSGDATISGNLTFGNADTDSVSFAADINSNFLPNITETYNLGSESKAWNDIYADGVSYLDTINLAGTEITATASELNILDGATVTTAELNILDGATVTTAEVNTLDGFTGTVEDFNYAKDLRATGVTASEFNKLDGFTGTVDDLNYAKDLRASGVTAAEFDKIDGLTAEASELNILDGATVTTGEVNTLSGVTSDIQTQFDNKQPLDAQLTDIAGLTPTDGHFIVGNGTNFITESGQTILTSVGVTATTSELNTLDGITATTTELNTLDGVTSSIQNQLNNRYTKAETDQKITDLVDAAPETLDTLNELAAALGDDPNFAATTANNIGTKVSKAGDTMTGDLDFGDNVKAKFGASDDLQIFHDGSNSYIRDNGTGTLRLQGSSSILMQKTDGELMFIAREDGAVELNHNGSQKLATTSTGVDVTGTVTADSLTVDGNAVFNSDSVTISDNIPKLLFEDTDTSTLASITANSSHIVYDTVATSRDHIFKQGGTTRLTIDDTGVDVTGTVTADGLTVESASGDSTALVRASGGGDNDAVLDLTARGSGGQYRNSEIVSVGENNATAKVQFKLDNSSGSLINVMQLQGNGDVQFYEDTGTTAKMVWDASAESLQIDGQIGITNFDALKLGTAHGGGASIAYSNDGNLKINPRSSYSTVFETGNVGIGTADPSGYKLHVKNSNSNLLRLTNSSGPGSTLHFIDNLWQSQIQGNAGSLLFKTGGANEVARIDWAGNLLVGTTDTTLYNNGAGGNTGVIISGSLGNIQATRSGSSPIDLNRLDSDGEIAIFRKDGSTVGSIGTTSGNLYIEDSDAGLRLSSSSNEVSPCGNNGANRDGALNLGATNNRFKDLHLSDTIYLSGSLINAEIKATTTNTTSSVIDSWSASSYTTAKIIVTANDGTNTFATELLIANTSSSVSAVEYGQIGTGEALATFDVDISGGLVRLLATATSNTSTTYKVSKQIL